MKCRLSHVTNSSSSSFIISRDQVKRKKLIKILLEIANKEYSYYDDKSDNDEFHYTLEDDVIEDCLKMANDIIYKRMEEDYSERIK